jgi:eukaryotic-like serine/threonine-protein kinase
MTGISTGSDVGPYHVDNLIARGGMGEVYRAVDTRLKRNVALKVLAPRYTTDSDRLARFAQEARTTALVNHPNIVAVYDVGSHDGVPFVVSELLDGQTLRDRLRDGALPVTTAIAYGLEITHGLVAAHDLGIVHRDLKPENIFITKDDRVKILDFGLAKSRVREPRGSRTHDSSATTESDAVVGTLGYASPEQVRGAVVDHRSDIFSLGIVLYEMAAGVSPFRRDSDVETLHAILKEEPLSLRKRDVRIPVLFDQIARHCLEKSRDARFQSARDLVFSLQLVQRALSEDERLSAPRHRLSRFASLTSLLRLF